MSAPRYFIYGLRDPRNGEIRYVGQTSQGMRRPRLHGTEYNVRKYSRLYVVRWIKKLQEVGVIYEIVVLQSLDEPITRQNGQNSQNDKKKLLDKAERFWISLGRRALGDRFTNGTDGGGGLLGRKHSEASKTRMSERQRANAVTTEWQVKNAIARKKANSPESRAKSAGTNRAFYKTPEGRARAIAVAFKIHTPEAHAKNAATQRDLAQTARGLELRAKKSADKKEALKTPEGRKSFDRFVAESRTDKARSKMSATKQQKAKTSEGHAQIMTLVRKAHTPEANAKRAKNRQAFVRTEEGRAQLLVMQAKAYSVESRNKQSKTRKAIAKTPEGRARILKMVEAGRLKREKEKERR